MGIAGLYGKPLEIAEKSRKTWMFGIWGIEPDEVQGKIIRVEFQLRREPLKEMGVGRLSDFLDEDIEVLKSLPRGLPDLHFFRHTKGLSGAVAGAKFGEKYFYKWWMMACENLGIEGVDLYGGTRHSSARALREFHSPEEIKRATMHSTNKAFERYYKIELDDIKSVYENTARKIG